MRCGGLEGGDACLIRVKAAKRISRDREAGGMAVGESEVRRGTSLRSHSAFNIHNAARRGAAALLPHTSSEPRPAFRRPHGPSSPPTPAIRIVLAGTAGCWLRRRPPPFFSSSSLVASLKSCHTNMEKASRLKRYFSSRHLVPRTSYLQHILSLIHI